MAESAQELEVREKKELVSKDEKTVPARYFVPSTDRSARQSGKRQIVPPRMLLAT